jgi:hypothetical protein
MELFDVYVARFEVPEERAVRGLIRVFGLSEASARIFYRSMPRMGKRQVPLMAAERYMRALSAVGAVCECRPSRPIAMSRPQSSSPPSGTSLPPPANTTPPPASSQPTPGSPTSSGFVPYGADMPAIPPTARVPRELSRMSASYDAEVVLSGEPLPRVALADVASSQHPRASGESYIPRRDSSAQAVRPDHIGLAPSSFAPKPGSTRTSPKRSSWYRQAHVLIVVFVAIATLLGFGYFQGWFETDDGRREAAWASSGIEVGDYEDVRTFLSVPGQRFANMPDNEAKLIIDGLFRAGARSVWAIGIADIDHTRVSRGLVVALPSDMNARRTIFFQHAPLTTTRRIAEDRGQPYLVLDL